MRIPLIALGAAFLRTQAQDDPPSGFGVPSRRLEETIISSTFESHFNAALTHKVSDPLDEDLVKDELAASDVEIVFLFPGCQVITEQGAAFDSLIKELTPKLKSLKVARAMVGPRPGADKCHCGDFSLTDVTKLASDAFVNADVTSCSEPWESRMILELSAYTVTSFANWSTEPDVKRILVLIGNHIYDGGQAEDDKITMPKLGEELICNIEGIESSPVHQIRQIWKDHDVYPLFFHTPNATEAEWKKILQQTMHYTDYTSSITPVDVYDLSTTMVKPLKSQIPWLVYNLGFHKQKQNVIAAVTTLVNKDVELNFYLPGISTIDGSVIDDLVQDLSKVTKSLKAGRAVYGVRPGKTFEEVFCWDFPVTDVRELNGDEFATHFKTCGAENRTMDGSLEMMIFGDYNTAGFTPVQASDTITRISVVFANGSFGEEDDSITRMFKGGENNVVINIYWQFYRSPSELHYINDKDLRVALSTTGVTPVVVAREKNAARYRQILKSAASSYDVTTWDPDSFNANQVYRDVFESVVTATATAKQAPLVIDPSTRDAEIYFLLPGTEEGSKSWSSDPGQFDLLIQDLIPQFKSLKVGRGLYGDRPCDSGDCFCQDFALKDATTLKGDEFAKGSTTCSGKSTTKQLEFMAYAADTAAGFTKPTEEDIIARLLVLVTDTESGFRDSDGKYRNYNLGYDLECDKDYPHVPMAQIRYTLKNNHVHPVVFSTTNVLKKWYTVVYNHLNVPLRGSFVVPFGPNRMDIIRSSGSHSFRKTADRIANEKYYATLPPTTTTTTTTLRTISSTFDDRFSTHPLTDDLDEDLVKGSLASQDVEITFLFPGHQVISNQGAVFDELIKELTPRFKSLKVARAMHGSRPDTGECHCDDFSLTDVAGIASDAFAKASIQSCREPWTSREALEVTAKTVGSFAGWSEDRNVRRILVFIVNHDYEGDLAENGVIYNPDLASDLKCETQNIHAAPVYQIRRIWKDKDIYPLVFYTSNGTESKWDSIIRDHMFYTEETSGLTPVDYGDLKASMVGPLKTQIPWLVYNLDIQSRRDILGPGLSSVTGKDVELNFYLPGISTIDGSVIDDLVQDLSKVTKSLKAGRAVYGARPGKTLEEVFCWDFPVTDVNELNGDEFATHFKTCGAENRTMNGSLEMMIHGDYNTAGFTPVQANDTITRISVVFAKDSYAGEDENRTRMFHGRANNLFINTRLFYDADPAALPFVNDADIKNSLDMTGVTPIVLSREQNALFYDKVLRSAASSYNVTTWNPDFFNADQVYRNLFESVVIATATAKRATFSMDPPTRDIEIYFLLPGTEEGSKCWSNDPGQFDLLIQDLIPQFKSLKVGRGLYGDRPCDSGNCFCQDFALKDATTLKGDEFAKGSTSCSGKSTTKQLEFMAYAADTAAGFTKATEKDTTVRFLVLVTDTESGYRENDGTVFNYNLGYDLGCDKDYPHAPISQIRYTLKNNHVHPVIYPTTSVLANWWSLVIGAEALKYALPEGFVIPFDSDRLDIIRSSGTHNYRTMADVISEKSYDFTLPPTTTTTTTTTVAETTAATKTDTTRAAETTTGASAGGAAFPIGVVAGAAAGVVAVVGAGGYGAYRRAERVPELSVEMEGEGEEDYEEAQREVGHQTSSQDFAQG